MALSKKIKRQDLSGVQMNSLFEAWIRAFREEDTEILGALYQEKGISFQDDFNHVALGEREEIEKHFENWFNRDPSYMRLVFVTAEAFKEEGRVSGVFILGYMDKKQNRSVNEEIVIDTFFDKKRKKIIKQVIKPNQQLVFS